MKKKLVIVISILILIGIMASIAYSNYIKTKEVLTGETVTGEATNANFAISVSVIIETPNVTIIYPENETYITTQNLWLNYSTSYTYTVWYSIDNVKNITLTENILFNTTSGPHTIRIYGNDTGGTLVSDNVTFTVDLSKFQVIYDEYAGSTKGSSTDFNKSSYEDLQNLSNIILENTDWGKIQFYEGINITDDADFSDGEINLEDNTNISENRVELNSTALLNFNTSATLYLYNLTFSDPRILIDSSVCPDTICTEISYSGGTLIFNVTQFTVYSAEETPAVTPTPSVGGGRIRVKKGFSVDKETLSISLRQGETKKDFLTIKNTGNSILRFSISLLKLEEFIKIDEPTFSLNGGESRMVILDFLARAETIPTLYLGRVIIKGDGIEKEVLVSIEVESKEALFDVKVEIPKRFMYVMPGEDVLAGIKIFNVERGRPADAFVEYFIQDGYGNDVLHETEMVFVETQTTFIKSFKIPIDAKHGKYIFYVRTTYNENLASGSAWFNVGKIPSFTLHILLLIAGAILIIVILIIILHKLRKIKIIVPKVKKKKIGERERGFEDYKKRIKGKIEKHKK
ncbi:MAG TPA: hypothetical protein VMV95_03085 [Bacillota bacterium]|nr:hypothetical protein [Bacillota bacterium]